jgi:nucleoid-associated protein YgaU
MRNVVCIIAALLLAPLAFAQAADAKADPHYAKAVELRAQAESAYGAGDYDGATALAREAKAELALVAGAPKPAPAQANGAAYPALYVVRLIPADRDCLWRIAAYPFIYNDPLKWGLIFDANKKTFRDPGNPNLIFPGQELVIPSIEGETREGTFDPAMQYEPLPKK